MWLDGRDVTRCRSTSGARLLDALPLRAPLAARGVARRSEAVGARVQRGLGGRHREAARLAVRAPPLAALAEDEVRGDAGARGRRVHRSAGRTGRPRRAARRLLRARTTSSSRERSAPASTRSCCSSSARGSNGIEIPKPPFTKAVGLPRLRAHWVRPEIVVQVAFIEWTVHGKLRHSRLLGRRRARQGRARDVVRETVVITHPDKVLFPDDGITKGELAAYYEAIAPVMLPHIRAPAGHDGAVSRTASARRASFRRTSRRASPTGWNASRSRRRTGRCTIRSSSTRESLLWVANQNCITPHVWTSRAPNLYQPDICVFDLDPSEDEPDVLRAAALALRDLLEELGLPSWVKTSGSKGFHIVVPLDGKTEYGEGRGLRARGGLDPRHARSRASHAGVQQGRPRRAHPRRHGAQRLQRDVRGRLRGARQSQARRCLRRARGRRSSAGMPVRGPSRCARWLAASQRSATSGRICAATGVRCDQRSRG